MNLLQHFFKTQLIRVSLVLGLMFALALAVGSSRPKTAEDEIMPAFGLRSGELITVDQVSKSEMAITLNGTDYVIDYVVYSNRSENFKLMVSGEKGGLVEQEAPPASTFRGSLKGVEGSRVIGCLTGDGCCAKVVFPSGEDFYIEPVTRTLDRPAFAGVHVAYAKDDVIPPAGTCGTETNLIEATQNVGRSNPPIARNTNLEVCELALDSDFEYFSRFGTTANTLAQMELIINLVNDQYESEVGIRHAISGAIVRTNANDPYTSFDASDLLNQFRNFHRTGPGAGSLTGDLRFLFTGRNINGSTIGVAFINAVCSNFLGFGLGQDIFPVSNMTDLVAHELGHNWNQPHCNCPNHTMNASLTGANDFNNTLTVPNLISYRNTRNCLDSIGPGGFGSAGKTNNDDWEDSILVPDPDFVVVGSNFNATTQSQEQDLVNVGSSTWWSVNADAPGTVTINTFGSDFDTQLHVYEFVPGGGLAGLDLVASDDDTVGQQSLVSFDMTPGTRYDIRVGGFRSTDSISSGSEGNIVVISAFDALVKGDLNLDGEVDFLDITPFIELLSNMAFQAEADCNCDGRVNFADISPFIEILSQN